MTTLSDIDRWFEEHPFPSKKPSKPTHKPTPAPRSEQYWRPEAVVLWESEWKCSCGCSGPATPQLFVRERMGRNIRLRAIASPNQYGLLPRISEQAPASQVKSCPGCFGGQTEYVERQLTLQFPEELEVFKRRVVEAVDLADMIDSMLEQMEDRPLPRNVRSRETPLPASWEFIPQDVEFAHATHRSIYHHSVASEFGPEMPYCWHEDA